MKVLLVSNEYQKTGRVGNPIIKRMEDALSVHPQIKNVHFIPFRNSFKCFVKIRQAAACFDIIHIQFGGLYALLIWIALLGVSVEKILTFHGTDIHAKEMRTTKSYFVKLKIWLNQKASFLSILLFDRLGFVTSALLGYVPSWIIAKCKKKFFVQSLGVDYGVFVPMSKEESCCFLGIKNEKYVLFSDKSNSAIKRRDIANAIVRELGEEYKMLIMSCVDPNMVPYYINACDFVLLTSDEEGSPNIVREALSLNKRVFSVDVGDVRQQIEGLRDSAIISRNPKDAANSILDKLKSTYSDNTRELLRCRIDYNYIICNLVNVYLNVE